MPFQRFLPSLTFALGFLAAGAACAHARLEAAEPRPASALDHAPTEVRLSFNETLEPAFSQIALTDAADKPVALARAKVDPATPSVLTAPLPALPAGQYHVRWSAMTRDGHKTKGEFTFSVK